MSPIYFIPETDDTDRNDAIVKLLNTLDRAFPGDMTMTRAWRINTDHPALVPVMRALMCEPKKTSVKKTQKRQPAPEQPSEQPIKTCEICGQPTKGGQYCSATCAIKSVAKESFNTAPVAPKEPLAERECEHCLKMFQPKRKDSHFCSDSCRQAAAYKAKRQAVAQRDQEQPQEEKPAEEPAPAAPIAEPAPDPTVSDDSHEMGTMGRHDKLPILPNDPEDAEYTMPGGKKVTRRWLRYAMHKGEITGGTKIKGPTGQSLVVIREPGQPLELKPVTGIMK